MSKYLVETFYTCSFKIVISHFLDRKQKQNLQLNCHHEEIQSY